MNSRERPARLRFDSFELDVETGELRKNGRRVRLQDQPAKLLVLLAGRAGELVTRTEIQHSLWGEDRFVEFDHAINTAVKKIREALGDDVERPRLIETLPRKGYRFIGTVEPIAAEPPPQKSLGTEPAATAGRNPDNPGLAGSAGAEPSSTDTEADPALLSRPVARGLFLLIQAGYLALYCSALYHLQDLQDVLDGASLASVDLIVLLVVVTAMCGIAVRLYLISSVGLSHPAAGRQFHRLFPAVLFLDGLWAASPLLAERGMGLGLALAAAAGMAYLPFSQRTLIRNLYP